MAESVTHPQVVHVDFGVTQPEFYDRAAAGELVVHEVAYGEDTFATVFVEPREAAQASPVAEARGVVGAIKKMLKRGGEVAPDPNIPTDAEKESYVALIRQRLADQPRSFTEPVFYLQQMMPPAAEAFAAQKRSIA